MRNEKKVCPLNKEYCFKECAWFIVFDSTGRGSCAIKVIAREMLRRK